MIVTLFVLLLPSFNTASAAALYKDIVDTHPDKPAFDFLVAKGIIVANSSSNFGINKEMTRLEAAELFVEALNLNTTKPFEVMLTDLGPDHASYPVIAAVVEKGIMSLDE